MQNFIPISCRLKATSSFPQRFDRLISIRKQIPLETLSLICWSINKGIWQLFNSGEKTCPTLIVCSRGFSLIRCLRKEVQIVSFSQENLWQKDKKE